MKILKLLTLALILQSCHGDSTPVECEIKGVKIFVVNGEHDYFIKMLGRDSLFANIVTSPDWGDNWLSQNYMEVMYYTKGSDVKTLSWSLSNKQHTQVTLTQHRDTTQTKKK